MHLILASPVPSPIERYRKPPHIADAYQHACLWAIHFFVSSVTLATLWLGEGSLWRTCIGGSCDTYE